MNDIWALLAGIQVSNIVVRDRRRDRPQIVGHILLLQMANEIQCINENTLYKQWNHGIKK